MKNFRAVLVTAFVLAFTVTVTAKEEGWGPWFTGKKVPRSATKEQENIATPAPTPTPAPSQAPTAPVERRKSGGLFNLEVLPSKPLLPEYVPPAPPPPQPVVIVVAPTTPVPTPKVEFRTTQPKDIPVPTPPPPKKKVLGKKVLLVVSVIGGMVLIIFLTVKFFTRSKQEGNETETAEEANEHKPPKQPRPLSNEDEELIAKVRHGSIKTAFKLDDIASLTPLKSQFNGKDRELIRELAEARLDRENIITILLT